MRRRAFRQQQAQRSSVGCVCFLLRDLSKQRVCAAWFAPRASEVVVKRQIVERIVLVCQRQGSAPARLTMAFTSRRGRARRFSVRGNPCRFGVRCLCRALPSRATLCVGRKTSEAMLFCKRCSEAWPRRARLRWSKKCLSPMALLTFPTARAGQI